MFSSVDFFYLLFLYRAHIICTWRTIRDKKRQTEEKVKYSTFYVFNIAFQSIITLLWNIGAAFLAGWLFVRFLNAQPWIYVPLIIIGVITGFTSMIRFILTSMKALDKLEEQKRLKAKKRKQEENKYGK